MRPDRKVFEPPVQSVRLESHQRPLRIPVTEFGVFVDGEVRAV
jgi:hypothetical protein